MSALPRVGGISAGLVVLVAITAFHIAYFDSRLAALALIYAVALAQLALFCTMRAAFRGGLAIGFCVFAPQLFWFWSIFGPAAICLWAILALFHGLFGAILWRAHHRLARHGSG